MFDWGAWKDDRLYFEFHSYIVGRLLIAVCGVASPVIEMFFFFFNWGGLDQQQAIVLSHDALCAMRSFYCDVAVWNTLVTYTTRPQLRMMNIRSFFIEIVFQNDDFLLLQVVEWEKRYDAKVADFTSYREQQNGRPEIQLQSDINMLTLEKVVNVGLRMITSFVGK